MLWLLPFACTTAISVPDTTPPRACASVSPPSLDFGALPIGASQTSPVTVTNHCDDVATGTLTLEGIEIGNPDAPFTLSPLRDVMLAPEASTTFLVTFAPVTAGQWAPTLTVRTDDPAHQRVVVPLTGASLGPAVAVTPLRTELGALWLGCEATATVELANVGTADLVVDALRFDRDGWSVTSPAAPFTVAPGASVPVVVRFAPVDTFDGEVHLRVASNDPAAPVVTFWGEGRAFSTEADTFAQPVGDAVDLVFVVSDHRTAADAQAALADAASTLVSSLNDLGLDWRVVGIAAGSGVRSEVIGPSTPGRTAAIAALFTPGTTAREHTQAPTQRLLDLWDGGDLDDVPRAGARLVVVVVSALDDPLAEHTAAETIALLRGHVHADARWTRLDAVSPSAGTCADPVPNLDALVALGDGIQPSICDIDGAAVQAAVAGSAAFDARRFPLHATPAPGTITVTVGGSPWTGWTVDGDVLVTDEPPGGGATVAVDYVAVPPKCE